MAFLGDFGDPETGPVEEPDYFTFHGEEFAVRPGVGAAALTRFAWHVRESDAATRRGRRLLDRARSEVAKAEARAIIDEAEFAGLAAIHDLLLAALGPDELARWEGVADAVGTDIDGLMRVANQVFSAISDRPTRQRPASSGGPLTTGTTSTDTPSSEDSGGAEVVRMDPAAARRAEMADIREGMTPVDEIVRRASST